MKRNQTLSMLLMLTTAAGLAIAEPAKKESTDKDLLRGPSVNQTEETTEKARDLAELDIQAALKEKPMELREVTLAIRNLGSDRARVSLGLTEEQNEKIKSITSKYREDIRAYQQENQTEFRALREAMRKEGQELRKQREEQKDAMSDTASEKPQESEAARKLREFLANAPATKAAMKGIESILSEEQFELVKTHVVVSRNRQQERGAQQRGNEGPRSGRRGMDSDEAQPQRRQRNSDRLRKNDED